jgi:hypothetical protein
VFVAARMLDLAGERRVTLPLVGKALPELCYWKRTLGMDCPGCGLTRCFVSLARADVARAWHYHPAGILLFAAVLFQVPYRGIQLWRLRRGKPELQIPALPAIFCGVCVLMIVQWLIRVLI